MPHPLLHLQPLHLVAVAVSGHGCRHRTRYPIDAMAAALADGALPAARWDDSGRCILNCDLLVGETRVSPMSRAHGSPLQRWSAGAGAYRQMPLLRGLSAGLLVWTESGQRWMRPTVRYQRGPLS